MTLDPARLPTHFVELCAGTASVSLWALARVPPLCGYMGSKRRWADVLVDALGVRDPASVTLVDAGPWGEVWDVLRSPSGRLVTCRRLEVLDEQVVSDGLAATWSRLMVPPDPRDDGGRVAQYLWLQARAAGTIPIWWSAERQRWESPTGARTEASHQRGRGLQQAGSRHPGDRPEYDTGSRSPGPALDAAGGTARGTRNGAAVQKQLPGPKHSRGIQRPATLIRRVEALERVPWSRVRVVHADVRTLAPPEGGGVVLFDPPYRHCPRYAELCPRADVLDIAHAWRAAGYRVVVCEAEPLHPDGGQWHWRRLPAGKPEWLTASWPIALPEQLDLWSAA